MRKIKLAVVILLSTPFLLSCAAESLDSTTENAEFALDACKVAVPTACTTAITEAEAVLAADANNTNAAMIKSSALATRGGIDILNVLSEIAETGGDDEERKYRTIHSALVGTVSNLDDLRSAITTLSGITPPAATAENYEDFYFQLGLLQAIEAFTMPSINAQPDADAAVDITATTEIDDTETANAEADFVAADDNLRTGGIIDSTKTGWELVDFVREYYCVLKTQAATDGVASGFNTAQLRALMRCQLNTEAVISTLLTNAEFPGTTIANCTAFVDGMLGSGGACNDAGDSEL